MSNIAQLTFLSPVKWKGPHFADLAEDYASPEQMSILILGDALILETDEQQELSHEE